MSAAVSIPLWNKGEGGGGGRNGVVGVNRTNQSTRELWRMKEGEKERDGGNERGWVEGGGGGGERERVIGRRGGRERERERKPPF